MIQENHLETCTANRKFTGQANREEEMVDEEKNFALLISLGGMHIMSVALSSGCGIDETSKSTRGRFWNPAIQSCWKASAAA